MKNTYYYSYQNTMELLKTGKRYITENIPLVRRLLYFTRGICSWNFRLNYYTEKQ